MGARGRSSPVPTRATTTSCSRSTRCQPTTCGPWAPGYHEVPPTSLIERWDGRKWSVVRSQNVHGALDTALFGIAIADTPDSAWAVGSAATTHSLLQAVVEHPSCQV